MTNQTQLADPSVYVNDVLIPIVPGTFKATPAKGEIKMRTLATGGAGVVPVAGLDTETLLDKISFSVANTPTGQSQVEDWKERSINALSTGDGRNTIKVSWPNQDTVHAYKHVYMTNSPEAEHSADGNIDVEFQGLRAGD